MAVYQARPGVATGYSVGILCAEWNVPFAPGDLNNATTFPFPVRYLEVPGVVGSSVLQGTGANFAELLGEAARQLEAEGVGAITGNCGFMAAYQRQVAAQVDVPVFLSSLVQIPMLLSMLGEQQRLGVLTANSAAMTAELFAGSSVDDTDRIVVQGLESCAHFNDVILKEVGTMDSAVMRSEIVAAAHELIASAPEVAMIHLECSDLPVYARDIRDATGLPVFDWANFITYVHNAVEPPRYPE